MDAGAAQVAGRSRGDQDVATDEPKVSDVRVVVCYTVLIYTTNAIYTSVVTSINIQY